MIGAADDLVVPPARTRRLIAVLRQPVLVRWIEHADHVSIYDEPSYRQAFRDAVTALLADPSPKALGLMPGWRVQSRPSPASAATSASLSSLGAAEAGSVAGAGGALPVGLIEPAIQRDLFGGRDGL